MKSEGFCCIIPCIERATGVVTPLALRFTRWSHTKWRRVSDRWGTVCIYRRYEWRKTIPFFVDKHNAIKPRLPRLAVTSLGTALTVQMAHAHTAIRQCLRSPGNSIGHTCIMILWIGSVCTEKEGGRGEETEGLGVRLDRTLNTLIIVKS